MNARSRFSQSAIPNGHTACGPTKKTVVSERKKKGGFLTDQRFSTAASILKSWTDVCQLPCLNRPLSIISLSHSDNQSESATKFYNSIKADVGGNVLSR